MELSVSLLTCPLSWAVSIPLLASSSDEDHLRHWGILVHDMSSVDLQACFFGYQKSHANDHTVFGTMYQLFRRQDGTNIVDINTEFGMDSLRQDFPMFAIKVVGKTTLSHAQIKDKGIEPS
jgi:hypothetical protein